MWWKLSKKGAVARENPAIYTGNMDINFGRSIRNIMDTSMDMETVRVISTGGYFMARNMDVVYVKMETTAIVSKV